MGAKTFYLGILMVQLKAEASMVLRYGPHAGKSTELVVLKFPDWVQFYIQNNRNSRVGGELVSLIRRFDELEFAKKCFQCKSRATRSSLYAGNAEDAMYWCDECDPYSLAAPQGKLVLITKYNEALGFVANRCGDKRGEKRDVIRRLAEAKGLPKRLGEKSAAQFFSQ